MAVLPNNPVRQAATVSGSPNFRAPGQPIGPAPRIRGPKQYSVRSRQFFQNPNIDDEIKRGFAKQVMNTENGGGRRGDLLAEYMDKYAGTGWEDGGFESPPFNPNDGGFESFPIHTGAGPLPGGQVDWAAVHELNDSLPPDPAGADNGQPDWLVKAALEEAPSAYNGGVSIDSVMDDAVRQGGMTFDGQVDAPVGRYPRLDARRRRQQMIRQNRMGLEGRQIQPHPSSGLVRGMQGSAY